jgi:hypothetical protein
MFQMINSRLAIVGLLFLIYCTNPTLSRGAEAMVVSAEDGIFAAFESHPLVGLGDQHDLANELAFYGRLIRDPRFAAKVGNVVAEFGASQHQDILDSYLAGEDVPYADLSKVWRNTVAFEPSPGVGYQTFLAQVREVNKELAPNKRIRVLLSEPPIDWSTVTTKEAWQHIYDQRDSHAAQFIVKEILNTGKKALVIYGYGHFFPPLLPSTWPIPSAGGDTLGEIVKRSHPGAFYLIVPYGGYKPPGCSVALEEKMKWPNRSLIAPIRGTTLQTALMPPGCMGKLEGIDPPVPAEELARLERQINEQDSGAVADALLYLAPANELMLTPTDATMWMDVEYERELRRRYEIRHGEPLWPLSRTLPLHATPPRPWTRR